MAIILEYLDIYISVFFVVFCGVAAYARIVLRVCESIAFTLAMDSDFAYA